MKSVLVTGASGFLGGALARRLETNGHRVLRAQRDGRGDVAFDLRSARELNDLPDPVDVVIHCAWDRQRGAKALNLSAVKTLLNFSESRSAQFIFVSSLAAHDGARSEYGQTKFAAEHVVAAYERSSVVRPGTIVGPGGIFENMLRMLARTRIAPVFFAKSRALQVVSLIDVTAVITRLIEGSLFGLFRVASEDGIQMRLFYEILRRALPRKPTLIDLPGTPTIWVLRILETLGLELPLTSENLMGLKFISLQPTRADWDEIWRTAAIKPDLPRARDCVEQELVRRACN